MAEIKALCRKSLESVPIGLSPEEIQNGVDFYKYMFTNHPDLRKYFKGAENYDAEKVHNSERFHKQGTRLLLAVHVIVDSYDDQSVFRAYARETINRHRIYKMDPALWSAFFTVFVNFLATKITLDEPTRQAWATLGKGFSDECESWLKKNNWSY